MKRFLVLFLAPTAVREDWSRTNPETRRPAEQRMRAEWGAWMRAHGSAVYDDPAKRACDEAARAMTDYACSMAIGRGPIWAARRFRNYHLQRACNRLRGLLDWRRIVRRDDTRSSTTAPFTMAPAAERYDEAGSLKALDWSGRVRSPG